MEYNISGFGEERSDMNYTGVSELLYLIRFLNHFFSLEYGIDFQLGDWLIGYQDPFDYWNAHPSYAICEVDFLLGATLMIIHGLYRKISASVKFNHENTKLSIQSQNNLIIKNFVIKKPVSFINTDNVLTLMILNECRCKRKSFMWISLYAMK